MERKIPLPIAGACHPGFLLPAVSNPCCGFGWPDYRRVFDLPTQRAVAQVGHLFSQFRKIPVGILLFIQTCFDDHGGFDHSWNGRGTLPCTLTFCGTRGIASILFVPGGPARCRCRICTLCVLYHERTGHFAYDLGIVDRPYPVFNAICNWDCWRISRDI